MEDVSAAHPKHKTAPLGQELVQRSHSTAALCWGVPAVLWGLPGPVKQQGPLLIVLCCLNLESDLSILSELQ